MGVEHRQQGQADAAGTRRRGDAGRQLGTVGIGLSRRIMVQIVEFGQRGKAALDHLHHGIGADRLHALGRQPVQETIHDLPPGPERIRRRATRLGQPRHAALEGVAVQVGHAGQRNAGNAFALARGIRLDGLDPAIGNGEGDPVGPAIGQQGMVENQPAHRGYSIIRAHHSTGAKIMSRHNLPAAVHLPTFDVRPSKAPTRNFR